MLVAFISVEDELLIYTCIYTYIHTYIHTHLILGGAMDSTKLLPNGICLPINSYFRTSSCLYFNSGGGGGNINIFRTRSSRFCNCSLWYRNTARNSNLLFSPNKKHPLSLLLPPPGCCSSSSSAPEPGATEAVLAEILEEEFGANKEDSLHIAHSCPKYLAMLLNDTLQDHTHLGSALPASSSLDIKEKLKCLAKTKEDNGMVPFLESLGLRLPSATHLARSFSAHHYTLPHLILK